MSPERHTFAPVKNKPLTLVESCLTLLLLLASCGGRAEVKPLMAGIIDDTPTDATVDTAAVAPAQQSSITTGTSLLNATVPAGTSEQMLERLAYIVSYNSQTRLPNYVAWHLTAAHASGTVKRTGDFREDDEVRGSQATLADYKLSGYDRGHMCPAGDNKWSETAMSQSFLLTNMCPQVHALNEGDWGELEKSCRKWAQRYGDIYIVCGPLLLGDKHTTIGKGKVVVPEAFFKVVMRLTDGKDGAGCKAIGFVYENTEGDRTLSYYARSVDDVERLTGIDFFPALPDDIETEAEATYDLDDW